MKSDLSHSHCSSNSARKARASRCEFAYADGRRCRMFRAADHNAFCLHHSREERQLVEAERIGQLLAATPTGHYLTATDLNPVLGKLYSAIAQNRIPHRNAGLLAYVSQLLLHSISLAKHEMIQAQGAEYWRGLVSNSLESPIPMPPPTKSAIQPTSRPSADPSPATNPNSVYSGNQPNCALSTEPLPTPSVFIDKT